MCRQFAALLRQSLHLWIVAAHNVHFLASRVPGLLLFQGIRVDGNRAHVLWECKIRAGIQKLEESLDNLRIKAASRAE